jgi:flavin reductase (DIM6/NTAB) family NADH-FMN oxidoreductase RutF
MTSPDTRRFRDTIGHFATGVSVVITQVGDVVHAMTANSVASVSLDPMLVLFCAGKKSRLAHNLPAVTKYSINILRSEQFALSTYFAGRWAEATPPPHRLVPFEGAARLEGCLAALACERGQIIEGGDHWVTIGRVVALHQGIPPLKPLLFYGGRYRDVDFSESKPAPDLTNVVDEPAHIFYGD